MSEEARHFPDFVACLSIVQRSLGLCHYHITVEECEMSGDYGEAEVDAENCVAVVRWDRKRCEADNAVAETALHEALHVMMADLTHAVETNPKGARVEEERIVRRLENVLVRSVFGRA